MDFEMKFLVTFYAVIAVAVSLACVAMLIQSAILGMLVVVFALFVGIGVLAADLVASGRSDDDDLPVLP